MEAGIDGAAFAGLLQAWDPQAELQNAWALTGGVSARITALEVRHADGTVQRYVVREHGEIDRAGNPHIARDEFRLLEIAHAHGVACPKPVFLDESCRFFANPVLVIEFIAGETEFAPDDLGAYVRQAIGQLLLIHQVPANAELGFLPRKDHGYGPAPAVLDDTMDEPRIRAALAAYHLAPERNRRCLLHGDFWPGNLLWADGQLAGVIDWEDAHTGDPLADLANARFEFLVAFGAAGLELVTSEYTAHSTLDLHDLAYWDLAAALRVCGKIGGWGLAAEEEANLRARHAAFVADALLRIGAVG